MRQLRWALRDVWKKKGVIALLYLVVLFVMFYFIVSIDLVSFSFGIVKNIRRVENFNILYVLSTKGASGGMDSRLPQAQAELYAQDKAYSILLHRSALPGYEDYDILFAVGAFDKVFRLDVLSEPSDKPRCFIGSAVGSMEIGNSVSGTPFASGEIPIVARIPAGMEFIYLTNEQSFDRCIVIQMDWSDVAPSERWGLEGNLCLVNLSAEELASFALLLGDGYYIRSLNHHGATYLNRFIESGLLSALFFLFVLVYVLINVMICVAKIVESNLREYYIHIRYGASGRTIFARTWLCVVLILLPPILAYNMLLSYFYRIPFWLAIAIIGLAAAVAAVIVLRNIITADVLARQEERN